MGAGSVEYPKNWKPRYTIEPERQNPKVDKLTYELQSKRLYRGTIIGILKGDTGSLDYSSYGLVFTCPV